MATPYVRAAVSADPLASADAKTLTLPPDLTDGDLVLLFATVQRGWPSVSPEWEIVDTFGTGAGLTGYVWRWTATSIRRGGPVVCRVTAAQGFAMAMLTIADPGLAVLRPARMMEGPHATLRCSQGFTIATAFITSNFGRKLVVDSSLTKVLTEGDNGVGMYLSIRYGPGQIGNNISHAITLPGEYTAFGGVILDLFSNAENTFALVKGRPNRYLDQELVG